MSRPRPKINNHIGKAPRGCDGRKEGICGHGQARRRRRARVDELGCCCLNVLRRACDVRHRHRTLIWVGWLAELISKKRGGCSWKNAGLRVVMSLCVWNRCGGEMRWMRDEVACVLERRRCRKTRCGAERVARVRSGPDARMSSRDG